MGSPRAAIAGFCGFGLALSLITPVVAADPTPGEQKARELVNHATEKSKAGDHKQAIDLYLQAYIIAPLPILLSNVGSEYEKLNDAVDSLKYFCKYLEAEPDGPMAAYATAHAKDMQGRLHNAVDEQTVCKPAKPPVEPLPPNNSAGSADTTVGTGSATTTDNGGGGGSAAAVETGGTVTAAPDPGKTERVVGLAVGGLGVVGLGLGIVFGIDALNASNEISNHCAGVPAGTICPAWPNNIKQIQADGQSDQNNQIAFLVAGGVLVVGGAVVYYLGHKHGVSAPAEQAMVTPVVAPGYEGFAYSRRF